MAILALAGCSAWSGCSSDHSENKGSSPKPATVQELEVTGLDDNTWVYISFEKGKSVGTSPLGDAEQDAAWSARKDWDIAFCGEMIRTNGGTSGNGKGAIQYVSNKSFNALDQAPEKGYTTDRDDIVVRR